MITTHLYNKRYRVDFDPGPHTYKVDGELTPSATKVTGIMDKPALKFWAANMAGNYFRTHVSPGQVMNDVEIEEIAAAASKAWRSNQEHAAKKGTSAHAVIEEHIRQQMGRQTITSGSGVADFLKKLHPSVANSVKKFYEWEKDHQPTYEFAESIIYSPSIRTIGTADIGCQIDGKLYVIDLKTGKGVYPEFALQVEFYRRGLCEEHPSTWGKESERGVLHIPGTDSVNYNFYDESDLVTLTGNHRGDDWETFVALRRAMEWKENNPKTWGS
jgi:hypothetical protein